MPTDPDPPRFMLGDATVQQLMAAAIENEITWLHRRTLTAGGSVGSDEGLHWALSERPERAGTVLLTAPGTRTAAAVDRVLRIFRERAVEHVTCWAFAEVDVPAVGPVLGARGFRWGGTPHWMVLDLHAGPEPPPVDGFAPDLDMIATDEPGDWRIPELPCFHPQTGPVRAAMAAARPARVWHLLIRQDGVPVGQSTVNVSSGPLGVCGLYETEVLPAARTRGLGLNRVDWIRRFALDLGCRYLVTNAAETADSLYRLIGFRTLDHGLAWGMRGPAVLREHPASQVALAEAIGFGDLDALGCLAADLGADALAHPLPNGMTPLQFAARTERRDAGEWLIQHGAEADVLSLWDLGRTEDVHTLLRRHPELVDAPRPRSGKTFLHIAVERGDAALTEVLLAHGADVGVRDRRFDGTPVQWASELRRGRILALLRGGTAVHGHTAPAVTP